MASTTCRVLLQVRARQPGGMALASPHLSLSTSTTRSLHTLSSTSFPRGSSLAIRGGPTVCLQLHQQQRIQKRTYLFWPSDWSEVRYRWNLFWNNKNGERSPTQIRIRLQDRYQLERTKLHDRYHVQTTKMKLRYQQQLDQLKQQYYNSSVQNRYQTEKFRLAATYRRQTKKLQKRYRIERDKFQRRLDERKQFLQQQQHLQQHDNKDHDQATTSLVSAYYQSRRLLFQQKRREFVKRWSARRKDMMADSSNRIRHYYKLFPVTEYCETDWFDAVDGRPLTSRDPSGRFVNPWMSWSTNGVHSVSNLVAWRYQRAVRQWHERGMASFFPKDLMQLLFGAAVATNTTITTSDKTGTQQQPKDDESAPDEPTATATSATTTHLDNDNDTNHDSHDPHEIHLTWIGHSTCLIRMGHATILTDPIFSHRCSPLPRMPGVGVARDVPPSLTIAELPDSIDVCLISHDHFDHLDQLSILHLRDRVQHWVLPTGLPQWLETRCSVDPNQMTELEWWQSVHFSLQPQQEQVEDEGTPFSWKVVSSADTNDDNDNNDNNQESSTMTITCCPAQHWSSRTFFDRCKRLWCGFAVETRTTTTANQSSEQQQQEQHSPAVVVQKFFFAGDTGMPRNGFPLFQQIGEFCARGLYHQHDQHQQHQDSSRTTSRSNNNHDEVAATTFHPFDLAAIPIGAYDPSFLMQDAHMNPEEALQCARQLQARKAVSIHWGTFALSEEPMDEPPKKLQQALQQSSSTGDDDDDDYDSYEFECLPIGGSMSVPSVATTTDKDLSMGDENEYDEDEQMMQS